MPVMVVPEDTLYLMKNFDMEKQIIMKSNIVLMKAGNEFMINNNQCEIPTYIIATKQGLLEFLNIFSRISN
jgi:L-asparaginase II